MTDKVFHARVQDTATLNRALCDLHPALPPCIFTCGREVYSHNSPNEAERPSGLSQPGQLPPLKETGRPPWSLCLECPSLPPLQGLSLLPLLSEKDGAGTLWRRGERQRRKEATGKEFPSRMERQLRENCRDHHIPLVHELTFGHKEE